VGAAGLRGDRRSTLARHRAPRSQAGKPLPHTQGRRLALREGARLRHLQDPQRGPRQGHDQDERRDGLALLHVARADALHARRRRALRRLGDRHDPLRAARWCATLRRRDDDRPGRRHHARGPAGSACAAQRSAARPRRRRASLPRERPGATLPRRRLARRGARAFRGASLTQPRRTHRGVRAARRHGARFTGGRRTHGCAPIGRRPLARPRERLGSDARSRRVRAAP
jgi:hypothetical protein